MGRDDVIDRWNEYIQDLYNDDRTYPKRENRLGPPIIEAEVIQAIHKMRNNKVLGPDNIPKEELESLDEYGIQILVRILNDIYNTRYIPEDLKRSIFIVLSKKPGAVDSEDHRTISLMSHVNKISLRIIMMRIRNKITTETSEECGFIEGKGICNAIYMTRMLSEGVI